MWTNVHKPEAEYEQIFMNLNRIAELSLEQVELSWSCKLFSK